MTERPVLFNDAMVRAVLSGRKTQTRRVLPPVVDLRGPPHAGEAPPDVLLMVRRSADADWTPLPCPYGAPGDRLWVREAWSLGRVMRDCEGTPDDVMYWSGPLPKVDPRGARLVDDWSVGYRATSGDEGPWRPSIHMPRWASRLTLRVTSVRVERVQSITEADAEAEGAGFADAPCEWTGMEPGYRQGFAHLWARVNAERPDIGWPANPWVWVVGFEREVTDAR